MFIVHCSPDCPRSRWWWPSWFCHHWRCRWLPWQSGRRDQVLGCSLISRGMRAGSGPRLCCCPLYSRGESYLGSSLVDVFTLALGVVVVVAAPVNNKLRKNWHSSGAEIPWSKCYSNSLCKESIMIFNSKSKLVLFKISVLDKSKRRHTIPLTSTECGAAWLWVFV